VPATDVATYVVGFHVENIRAIVSRAFPQSQIIDKLDKRGWNFTMILNFKQLCAALPYP
jgi:hypothetical protein